MTCHYCLLCYEIMHDPDQLQPNNAIASVPCTFCTAFNDGTLKGISMHMQADYHCTVFLAHVN